MIQDILRKIGLTDSETKVYIALLDLGKSTSGEILQKANLNTGKIYDILGSLKNKGLVSEITESGVKRFFPADPSQILDFIDEKKEELQKHKDSLIEEIPKIIAKINAFKEQQRIEVFHGFNGLKAAHKKESARYSKGETLRILGIMERKKYPKKLNDYYMYNLYPKREEKKIITKKILDKDAINTREDHEKDAQVRYFPYVSPVAVVTIKDLTIIEIITQNPIVITIESLEVSKSFIQQFELLWKISKPSKNL